MMVIMMEKLFAAIRDMHPDAEVIDVRFQVGNNCGIEQSLDDIDDGFANVISRGRSIDVSTLSLA